MGLDFWAVKIKKGIKEDNFKFNEPHNLIEDVDIYDYIDKSILDFKIKQNDKELYELFLCTVGYFVGGDPIYNESQKDINILADKLNSFIKENPDYKYKPDGYVIYSNEDIKKVIAYINSVRDSGFILWCSW